MRRHSLLRSATLFLTLAAAALSASPALAQPAQPAKKPLIQVESRAMGEGNVLTGLDVLRRDGYKLVKNKKLALLTNASAIDREGNHILDLLHGQPGVELVSLFSPEHGLYGDLDTKVPDMKDTATGLMVYSLYGAREGSTAKPGYPEQEHLKGIDAVVIDMMDIGARYYTYLAYMGKMMESCKKAGVDVIVLDRPNPIGGLYVDGPHPDFDKIGDNTNYFDMPIAHGMTMGELARMFNKEMRINCRLTVVPVENWTRDMYLDETGLRWTNPSPNIQDLDAAIVYPGIGMTEAIMSMGRGTDEPFHVFGSPLIDNPDELIKFVEDSGVVEGVKLTAVDFTPTGTLARWHHGEGKLCRGARMEITDREKFDAYNLGQAVIHYMHKTYGNEMTTNTKGEVSPKYNVWKIRQAASSWVCARTAEGKDLKETLDLVRKQVAEFLPKRAKYLMYKDRSEDDDKKPLKNDE
jgi:uncharacterized protein YbbC (DUF1343 family)